MNATLDLKRRRFLHQTARLSAFAALSSSTLSSFAADKISGYPFNLGVASGSPRSDSVVLWTRLLPDPLNAVALAPIAYKVRWEISEDESFHHVIGRGEHTALPELAHSVH
ncbi:PhoD-like phosphatase N-terminal domain-containing protein, partial [Undibacterium sp. 10I3]